MKSHTIRYSQPAQALTLDWDQALWKGSGTLRVESFHPRSSAHRPLTEVKMLASGEAMHVLFRVQDRYVMSLATQYQDMVCRDSCVEFFWEPVAQRGYFNFEINCGGVLLLYYIEDPGEPTATALSRFTPVAADHSDQIEILSTLPRVNPVEIFDPIEWRVAARIPYRALEPYVGAIQMAPGAKSRGNFYKCCARGSHPHWASWCSIGQHLNFHQPSRFGQLVVTG